MSEIMQVLIHAAQMWPTL